MKEKYILTIDEIKICVRSDESAERIEEVEETVNRSLRAIHASAKNCSKVEAALISALDFCSEAIEYREKYEKALAEIESLRRSIEILKK